MRKIFLLGTMLGVASAAFAFGGVFSHGSKSTAYKGGVDAIGAHFGGEKKTADITADTPSCPEHSEKVDGICQCVSGYESDLQGNCIEICPEGILHSTRDGSCSICAEGQVYLPYMNPPCQYTVSGCASNDDCESNEYCKLEGDDEDYEARDCYPATGTCTPLGGSSSANIVGIGTVLKSADSINWWSANNWCKAQGKNLISLAQLGCYENGITLKEEHTNTASFYCCAEGHDCDEWGEYWNGTNIVNGYEQIVNDNYSPTMVALRQAFDNDWFWLSSSNYECMAVAADLRPGYVDRSGRNNPGNPDGDANAAYCY